MNPVDGPYYLTYVYISSQLYSHAPAGSRAAVNAKLQAISRIAANMRDTLKERMYEPSRTT